MSNTVNEFECDNNVKINRESEHKPEHSKDKVYIPRPISILTSIFGVLSDDEIQKTINDSYFKANLVNYLSNNWKDEKLTKIKQKLVEDQSIELKLLQSNGPNEGQVKAMADNILTRLSNPSIDSEIINHIRNLICVDGYSKGQIKSHIYPDVLGNITKWRMNLLITLYSFGLGDPSGQKLFLQSTSVGDISKYFNNFFTTTEEIRKTPKQYEIISRLLREEPKNLLFLTSDIEEATVANKIQMNCILVIRNPQKYQSTANLNACFKIVKSLDDLEFIDDGTRPCC